MIACYGDIWYCFVIYIYIYGGFPKLGVPFSKGPNNEDYSILGSVLGSPYFGKLPYIHVQCTSYFARVEIRIWEINRDSHIAHCRVFTGSTGLFRPLLGFHVVRAP